MNLVVARALLARHQALHLPYIHEGQYESTYHSVAPERVSHTMPIISKAGKSSQQRADSAQSNAHEAQKKSVETKHTDTRAYLRSQLFNRLPQPVNLRLQRRLGPVSRTHRAIQPLAYTLPHGRDVTHQLLVRRAKSNVTVFEIAHTREHCRDGDGRWWGRRLADLYGTRVGCMRPRNIENEMHRNRFDLSKYAINFWPNRSWITTIIKPIEQNLCLLLAELCIFLFSGALHQRLQGVHISPKRRNIHWHARVGIAVLAKLVLHPPGGLCSLLPRRF